MKKIALRMLALTLACLCILLCCVSCSNKLGKTLLTLEKDGISVSISVNIYELMLSRMKGTLALYGYTANGATASSSAFWDYTDKFNGTDLQTLDEYYRDCILDNCRTYLVALYLFEKEGLSLSETEKEEIENRMFELLRTDGDGSKTKLNSVLASYGVNYDILKEAYTIEAKVAAVQEHLYGENGSKLGYNIKDEYLAENYVHFRQIFLASYRYVYEADKNGDTIYYYTDGDNKDHIYYDVHNGEIGYDENGKEIKDENGDTVYFVKGSDMKKIAYDSINGTPAYMSTEDGSEYQTEKLTDEELKKLEEEAKALCEEVKNMTASEFEAIMEEKSDDMGEAGEYDDGYYLQKNIDYTASGDDYMYLDTIVSALESMQDGDVMMVQSNFGYHIIRKYPHTEKAYEQEENETWFSNFTSDLIEQLFLAECQSHFADIRVQDNILATSATMKEVKTNYNY